MEKVETVEKVDRMETADGELILAILAPRSPSVRTQECVGSMRWRGGEDFQSVVVVMIRRQIGGCKFQSFNFLAPKA